MMASAEGGVEIEEVAPRPTPTRSSRWPRTPRSGCATTRPAILAFGIGITTASRSSQFIQIAKALYKAYRQTDATLAEINPLVVTRTASCMALDAKIVLDDNALFRHPTRGALRDPADEPPGRARRRARPA
jgi:succinyl-CoA synthetase beta subunit